MIIVLFIDSEFYLNDTIGLKTLDIAGKLLIKQYECQHEQFKHPNCFLKKFDNQLETLMDETISIL